METFEPNLRRSLQVPFLGLAKLYMGWAGRTTSLQYTEGRELLGLLLCCKSRRPTMDPNLARPGSVPRRSSLLRPSAAKSGAANSFAKF
jgi:hypothetical protein